LGKHEVALVALSELSATSQDFSVYFRQGLAWEALGRLSEAITAYRSAVQHATGIHERFAALRSAANVEKKRGNLTASQKDLKEALAIQPRDSDVLRTLTETAYQAKDYEQATEWARILVSLGPTVKDREFLAGLLAARRRYREAVEEYSKLATDATDEDVRRRSYMNVGYSYAHLGLHPQAVEAFRKAASIGADSIANAALAEALDQSGRTAEAIDVWKRELRLRPSAEAQVKIGNLYAKLGDDTLAAVHLERAVAELDSADLHFRLATLYATTDTESALRHIDKAVQNGLPRDLTPLAYQQQGYLYSQLGRHSEAADAFRMTLGIRTDSTVVAALAQELEQSGRTHEAIDVLRAELQQHNSADTQLRLGNLYMKVGDTASAVRYLEDSLETNNSADTHYRLGMLYVAEGQNENALRHLDLAVHSDLAPALVPTAYQQQGYIYVASGRAGAAVESFQKSIDASNSDLKVRQDLGFALFSLGRWDQALKQFLLVSSQQRSSTTMLQVARCYQQLKQTEMAIQYVQLALGEVKPEDKDQQRQLYNELGYLYASRADHTRSIEAWGRSLALQPDPEIALDQGRALRLSGHTVEAEQTFNGIVVADLSIDRQAKRLDELAEVYDDLHEPNKSLNAMIMANALQPMPEREYRLGLRYLVLKKTDSAIRQFEGAVAQDPGNISYKESLAYAYRMQGRYRDAARLFEVILKQHPDRSSLYEDLAYTYMHEGENVRAAYWFRRAIDVRSQEQPLGLEGQRKKDRETYGLRQEVSNLTRHYSLTFYQSYRASDAGMSSSSLYSGGGVIPSQGGVELSVQPAMIGFRDERILQVFARTLWSNQPQSLWIDQDSVQVGVGIRYKPVKSQNVFLSAERLMAIGSHAIDSWLLRATYAWGVGYDLKPGQREWNNTQFYGDVGYFTRTGGTWAYYAEARQGITLNFRDRILITPHLVIDGRNQNPDPFGVSYLEGGTGVTISYLFAASRYESHRSSLEFLIQYKHGILPSNPGGLVFTTAWRFSGGSILGGGIKNNGIQ